MRQLSDIVFNQSPLILHAGATVKKACRQMRERGVGSVLVVDEAGALIGIFTGRDAVSRVLAEGRGATAKLSEVMTKDPMTMPPDFSAIDALRLMWDHGFRHVPVCREGQILGVVSRGDFKGFEQDRLEEEVNLWEHLR
jgi:CBS domain-containing protein